MSKKSKDNISMLSFSRNTTIMALVSMFNDIGSEMVIPLLPAILVEMFGAPAFVIGAFLGLSQFFAKATSVYFGDMSDRKRKRKMFVVGGYSLSAVMQALLTTATSWMSFILFYLFGKLP